MRSPPYNSAKTGELSTRHCCFSPVRAKSKVAPAGTNNAKRADPASTVSRATKGRNMAVATVTTGTHPPVRSTNLRYSPVAVPAVNATVNANSHGGAAKTKTMTAGTLTASVNILSGRSCHRLLTAS